MVSSESGKRVYIIFTREQETTQTVKCVNAVVGLGKTTKKNHRLSFERVKSTEEKYRKKQVNLLLANDETRQNACSVYGM